MSVASAAEAIAKAVSSTVDKAKTLPAKAAQVESNLTWLWLVVGYLVLVKGRKR